MAKIGQRYSWLRLKAIAAGKKYNSRQNRPATIITKPISKFCTTNLHQAPNTCTVNLLNKSFVHSSTSSSEEMPVPMRSQPMR